MFWRFLAALVALGLWCMGIVQCAELLSSKFAFWWMGIPSVVLLTWIFLKFIAYLVTSLPLKEEPAKDAAKS